MSTRIKKPPYPSDTKQDTSPVQVHIRLKKTSEDETGGKFDVFADDRLLHSNDGGSDKWLVYDHIHTTAATNEDVYKQSGYHLVEQALVGYNTAIFAYGQQGSGKTSTLMSRDGITAHAVSHLFNRIKKIEDRSYKVSCTYLQIYNEHIYDLLSPGNVPGNGMECTVREHKTRGLYVDNITKIQCHSPKDVYNLINIGRRSLVQAERKLNYRSSRSHAVCQLQIEYENPVTAQASDGGYQTSERNEENVIMDFTTVPLLRKNVPRGLAVPAPARSNRDNKGIGPEYRRSNSFDVETGRKVGSGCGHVSHHRGRCPGNKQGEAPVFLRSNSFSNDNRSPVRHARRHHNHNSNFNNNNSSNNNNNRYVNRFNMADIRYSPTPHHLDNADDQPQDANSGTTGPVRYPSIFSMGGGDGGGVYSNPNFNPRAGRTRRSSIPRLKRSQPGAYPSSSTEASDTSTNTSTNTSANSSPAPSLERFDQRLRSHGNSKVLENRHDIRQENGKSEMSGSDDSESQYLNLENSNEEMIKIYDIISDEGTRDVRRRSRDCSGKVAYVSKITIVDLAGSERIKKSQADGERLREAQHINLSLLELGNVISALADGKKRHVPYRNSVLTRLLQDTLSGGSIVTFLLCVSTKACDSTETKCTLEFGQKLKKVLTTPSINVELYKWKYENGIKEESNKTNKRKRSIKRNKAGKLVRKSEKMEFTNVVREYEESKTLVDMLQYMMALNEQQQEGSGKEDEEEEMFFSTDIDTEIETETETETETGWETDHTVCGSDAEGQGVSLREELQQQERDELVLEKQQMKQQQLMFQQKQQRKQQKLQQQQHLLQQKLLQQHKIQQQEQQQQQQQQQKQEQHEQHEEREVSIPENPASTNRPTRTSRTAFDFHLFEIPEIETEDEDKNDIIDDVTDPSNDSFQRFLVPTEGLNERELRNVGAVFPRGYEEDSTELDDFLSNEQACISDEKHEREMKMAVPADGVDVRDITLEGLQEADVQVNGINIVDEFIKQAAKHNNNNNNNNNKNSNNNINSNNSNGSLNNSYISDRSNVESVGEVPPVDIETALNEVAGLYCEARNRTSDGSVEEGLDTIIDIEEWYNALNISNNSTTTSHVDHSQDHLGVETVNDEAATKIHHEMATIVENVTENIDSLCVDNVEGPITNGENELLQVGESGDFQTVMSSTSNSDVSNQQGVTQVATAEKGSASNPSDKRDFLSDEAMDEAVSRSIIKIDPNTQKMHTQANMVSTIVSPANNVDEDKSSQVSVHGDEVSESVVNLLPDQCINYNDDRSLENFMNELDNALNGTSDEFIGIYPNENNEIIESLVDNQVNDPIDSDILKNTEIDPTKSANEIVTEADIDAEKAGVIEMYDEVMNKANKDSERRVVEDGNNKLDSEPNQTTAKTENTIESNLINKSFERISDVNPSNLSTDSSNSKTAESPRESRTRRKSKRHRRKSKSSEKRMSEPNIVIEGEEGGGVEGGVRVRRASMVSVNVVSSSRRISTAEKVVSSSGEDEDGCSPVAGKDNIVVDVDNEPPLFTSETKDSFEVEQIIEIKKENEHLNAESTNVTDGIAMATSEVVSGSDFKETDCNSDTQMDRETLSGNVESEIDEKSIVASIPTTTTSSTAVATGSTDISTAAATYATESASKTIVDHSYSLLQNNGVLTNAHSDLVSKEMKLSTSIEPCTPTSTTTPVSDLPSTGSHPNTNVPFSETAEQIDENTKKGITVAESISLDHNATTEFDSGVIHENCEKVEDFSIEIPSSNNIPKESSVVFVSNTAKAANCVPSKTKSECKRNGFKKIGDNNAKRNSSDANHKAENDTSLKPELIKAVETGRPRDSMHNEIKERLRIKKSNAHTTRHQENPTYGDGKGCTESEEDHKPNAHSSDDCSTSTPHTEPIPNNKKILKLLAKNNNPPKDSTKSKRRKKESMKSAPLAAQTDHLNTSAGTSSSNMQTLPGPESAHVDIPLHADCSPDKELIRKIAHEISENFKKSLSEGTPLSKFLENASPANLPSDESRSSRRSTSKENTATAISTTNARTTETKVSTSTHFEGNKGLQQKQTMSNERINTARKTEPQPRQDCDVTKDDVTPRTERPKGRRLSHMDLTPAPSRFLHHVRHGCWCERSKAHS